MQASTMSAGPASQTLAIGRNTCAVAIPGRSKERSDAAQTLEAMPFRLRFAAVRNSVRQQLTIKVTAWIPGSSRRRYAAASPWNDEV
ncbi:hypothetical protein FJ420_18010 [Mesorhizobium sp. B3-1-3]|uniref:hypothetical protein n=1 Tax=unclassified Mesorhizobium TaxID=325217 RepID=UPI001129594D|nr:MULTISPECIES: hypothetical protein [unclassified Mesorhizobium]TPI68559.1 hypothetical protein FJ424_08145 [Mesorhizobium sp. B3-1-8]TPI69695.1 hypothetical protein FJ420_18010 [Mesorhizobium sp. B3-1-3]